MRNSLQLSPEARSAAKEATLIRRTIHQHPELGFQEKYTSDLIFKRLKKFGVAAKRMLGTGVVALIRGKQPGKTLLVRADIDGLPLTEETKVPFRSRVKGRMHA